MKDPLKRRLTYFSLSILCFIACILIVILFNDNQFIRGFIGDIIVILLIYFLIKSFHDFHAVKLAIFTLVIAYITEFLQYLEFATFLGLEHNTMVQLVLGSVFDPYDLMAYTIGAVLVYLIDTKILKKWQHKRNVLLSILLCYLLLLVYWMLFGFGRGKGLEYRYNIIPFKTINQFLQVENFNFKIWLINIVGNIGVFIPFGILLPMVFKDKKIKLLLIFEIGLLTLEMLQLVTKRGSFDIDDLILNTLGAIIGYGIYSLYNRFKHKD